MKKSIIVNNARKFRDFIILPNATKFESLRDHFVGLGQDPGIDCAVDESIKWLCRAQKFSTSKDGGVARHYSLINGWSASYPETTGYIIPTLMSYAKTAGERCCACATALRVPSRWPMATRCAPPSSPTSSSGRVSRFGTGSGSEQGSRADLSCWTPAGSKRAASATLWGTSLVLLASGLLSRPPSLLWPVRVPVLAHKQEVAHSLPEGGASTKSWFQ